MKRIAIFSFYDKDGIVDAYVEFLLKELKAVSTRLIIVINGNINQIGFNKLLEFTKEIVIRENAGFDAGAYADILINYLEKTDVDCYDELLLCNDTFYGPFQSFNEIFNIMRMKSVDFWGLNIVDTRLLGYIESYFLVFRKNIIKENYFFDYFKQNIKVDETKKENVCISFERRLFQFLIKQGHKYATYSNTALRDIYINPSICIEQYGLPIMKKRSMDSIFYNSSDKLCALKYIYNNTDYNLQWIIENAQRLYGFSKSIEEICMCDNKSHEQEYIVSNAVISEQELLEWVGDDPFYIYGAGNIAKRLYMVHLREKNFLGFIVSDTKKKSSYRIFDHWVYCKDEIDVSEKIVVGVAKKNYVKEIKESLGENPRILYLYE